MKEDKKLLERAFEAGNVAGKYQEFFNFMNQEHDLILTMEEMDEIVFEAQKLVKKFDIANVVGRSEQLPNRCSVCGRTDEERLTMTSMCGVSACPY